MTFGPDTARFVTFAGLGAACSTGAGAGTAVRGFAAATDVAARAGDVVTALCGSGLRATVVAFARTVVE